MQLLDSEQLELAFHLHGVSRDVQARKFYGDVWGAIKAAEKARDPISLSVHERELRHLCREYFTLMGEWRMGEEEVYEGKPVCALSEKNMKEALAAIPVFEKQFFRYALCYMELNRALIHGRTQVAHFARDYEIEDFSKIMEVNHNTGAHLARAQKERKEILDKRLRLERVRIILQQFDPLMELLGDGLPATFGDAGDRLLTQFKGALRKGKFTKAESLVAKWKNPRLCLAAREVLALAKEHQPELKAQDGLILHSGELSLIDMYLKMDERRVNDFMAKYDVPYMVFQYKNLLHQGYLLGRIGSIEGLIISHAKLLSLAARPHNDPDYAKMQEETILVPTRMLLQDKFKTLGAIFDDMETTLVTLNTLFTQTRDYMTLSSTALQNTKPQN